MKKSKKQLQSDITQTATLRTLMTAYEELAALRMKRIREQVLLSREFHTTLSQFFHEIRTAKSLEHGKTTKKSKTLAPPQEKHLAILISDDKGLYGDILSQTKETFIKEAREHPDYDLAIIGTLEKDSITKALPGRQLEVFPFSGNTPDMSSLKDLLSLLSSFTQVTVIHGQFISLINQQAQSSHLTGDEEATPETVAIRQYVLEPSRLALKEFFQKEILMVLFEQALLEGTLSKEASRMLSLEKATDEARNRLKKLQRLLRVATAQRQNKEQITYLAGLSLWGIQ